MERHLVTIQKIEEKKAISNADRIEAVRIKGWWVVTQKDQFQVNDPVLYYEIDSFIPVRPEYEFLLRGSKPKKMLYEGKEIEGIRLKTIKLKGQISQGLIMPVPDNILPVLYEDVTEKLGVIKYELPIPPQLSGKIKGSFPSFIPKTDEERIQNIKEILDNYYVTEKIDGSSVTYYKKDGVFGVCSRNVELCEEETTQWKIAKELKLQEKLFDNFAIQGEVVGEGIQKNPYKIKGHKVFFFNAYNIKSGVYLNYEDLKGILKSLGLEIVPLISDSFVVLPFDEILLYAEGKSLLNPNVEREGIVVRPKIEMQYCGQRLSFKVVSNNYLLKNEI